MEILLCYDRVHKNIDEEMQKFMKNIEHNIHCSGYYRLSRKILIEPDIKILFRYDYANEIKGLRPDYFWTNSADASRYLHYACSTEITSLYGIKELIRSHIKETEYTKKHNHSDDKFDAFRYSYINTDFNKTLHNKELYVSKELIKLKTKLNEIYGTNCFKEKENEIMPTKNINAGTLYINDIPLGRMYPEIKNVIFSGPCTIVMWSDGDKTIVRCDDENFDKEKGLAMAIAKKFLGTNKTKSNYNDIFKKWCTEDEFSEEENKVIETALEGIKKEIDNNSKKKIKMNWI